MFLKSLIISNGPEIIRNIEFRKGLNLIVDETESHGRKSGNNVGKTTVLKLVDFCLGGKADSILKDKEFKNSNRQVEKFLTSESILITMILVKDIDDPESLRITVKRNFKQRGEKIQEIDGIDYNNIKEFNKVLGEKIFGLTGKKPTFRQAISKNIRIDENSLKNVVKVLHGSTTGIEYEALYLFWFGINVPGICDKKMLSDQIKFEEKIRKHLEENGNIDYITQCLITIEAEIAQIDSQLNSISPMGDYHERLKKLNDINNRINSLKTQISELELRKSLIEESIAVFDSEKADIDKSEVEFIYMQAKSLIPEIQKTFDETIKFHNEMLENRKKYVKKDLPQINEKIDGCNSLLQNLLKEKKQLADSLYIKNSEKTIDVLIKQSISLHEQKGHLEETRDLILKSLERQKECEGRLAPVNSCIQSKYSIFQERIAKFNSYFTDIYKEIYDDEETFILSSSNDSDSISLDIRSTQGNPGTGKKKSQVAAFDLAYIQFAENAGIPCLHFILYDQVENIHGNQLVNLLLKVVDRVKCQYIIPVLKDKLPDEIKERSYQCLKLSQEDKLFKI